MCVLRFAPSAVPRLWWTSCKVISQLPRFSAVQASVEEIASLLYIFMKFAVATRSITWFRVLRQNWTASVRIHQPGR